MWQPILFGASTALGLILIGFSLRYRVTGLDYSSILWRIQMALSGVAAGIFAVAATVDNFTWWLIPGLLFAGLMFLSAEGTVRSLKTEAAERAAHPQANAAYFPGGFPFLQEPKVVDYSGFVLRYGWTMDHVREDGGLCEVYVGPGTPRLSEFIEIANAHECASNDATVLMNRVA